MTVGGFLKLVEIQTKVASIIPFLLGTFYALYKFKAFIPGNFVLMLVSLLCVDMATTAINNFMDYKRAVRKCGYGYERHNAVVSFGLKESTVLAVIIILLLLAIFFGILLLLNTNIVVLILGAASFLAGVLYSFGPVPISRTPFGEIVSGGFMGFVIPFIAVYIHVYNRGLLDVVLDGLLLKLAINIPEVLFIVLVSLPAAAGIADIMLANNICDVEEDIENKRYTLPVYIGKNSALRVFKALYYISYADLLALLVLKAVPPVSVVTLATFIVVSRNIKIFNSMQTKKETFVLSVKNFVIVNLVLVLSLAAGSVLESL